MILFKAEFYIYNILKDGELIYIGKGRKYRYLQSKLQFSRMYPESVITTSLTHEGLQEEVAYQKESELIKKLKPSHNRNNTTIGLMRNRTDTESRMETQSKFIFELKHFISVNGYFPKKSATTGSEEYRLARRGEAFCTKTNFMYDEILEIEIKNIKKEIKNRNKNSKEALLREEKSKKGLAKIRKLREFVEYVKREGKLPCSGKLGSVALYYYYPSGAGHIPEFYVTVSALLNYSPAHSITAYNKSYE